MIETLRIASGLNQIFDKVIIAGEAPAHGLKYLSSIVANEIIWFEPNADAYEALERNLKKLEIQNVRIERKALCTKASEALPYYKASHITFSSTAIPLDIKTLRPGISFEKIGVEATPISKELQKCSINVDLANLLILSVNGAEHELIKELTPDLFSSMIVRTTHKALYETGNAKKLVRDIYQENETPFAEVSEPLPPFINLITVRAKGWSDTTKNEELNNLNHDLRHKLDAAVNAKKESDNEILRLQQLLQKTKDTHELTQKDLLLHRKKLDELGEQLAESNKSSSEALRSANQKSEDERQRLNEALISAKNALEEKDSRISNLSKDIQTLKETVANERDANEKSNQTLLLKFEEEKDTLTKQVNDKLNENARLSTDLKVSLDKAESLELENAKLQESAIAIKSDFDNLQSAYSKAKKEMNDEREQLKKCQSDMKSLKMELKETEKREVDLQKRLKSATKALKEMAANHDFVNNTLSLNTKLMNKMQLETDSLRLKLSEKSEEEKKLRELIGELHAKLKVASAFYHQIEQNYPELLTTDSN